MIRLLNLLVLAFFLTASLSACGKKGDPKPPNKDTQYPRTYPR